MTYADLHIHSSFSDGYYTPEKLVDLAIEKGVNAISITDHDSITSQYITKVKYDNINIIPGIEFSSRYNGEDIHILGYFIDIDNNYLKDVLCKVNKFRMDRSIEILDKLKKENIFLELDDLLLYEKVSIGRRNIANAMLKKGYVNTYSEAFNIYLARNKKAYVPGEKLETREVIEIIRECGGMPILAHPGKIYRDLELEKMIKEFKCFGIKGIEVYHPSHTREKVNYFYNMCKKYKLLISGGSDFHGEENQKNIIGDYGINKELYLKMINLKK